MLYGSNRVPLYSECGIFISTVRNSLLYVQWYHACTQGRDTTLFNGISSAILYFKQWVPVSGSHLLGHGRYSRQLMEQQYGYKKGQLSRDRNRFQVLLLHYTSFLYSWTRKVCS